MQTLAKKKSSLGMIPFNSLFCLHALTKQWKDEKVGVAKKIITKSHKKMGCVNWPFKDKRNLNSICLKAKIRVNSLDGLKSGSVWDVPMNEPSYKVSIPLWRELKQFFATNTVSDVIYLPNK